MNESPVNLPPRDDNMLSDEFIVALNSGMVNGLRDHSREYCKLWMSYYYQLCQRMITFLLSQGASQDQINALDESDLEAIALIQANVGYFIPAEHLFTTWLNKGWDFSADDIHLALSTFERINPRAMPADFNLLSRGLSSNIETLGNCNNNRARQLVEVLNLTYNTRAV